LDLVIHILSRMSAIDEVERANELKSIFEER